MQMTSLKNKFISWIIGIKKNKVHLTGNIQICVRGYKNQMFFKTGILKNFANFSRKHFCSTLLIKLLNTDVYLWILWNFLSAVFYRPSGGCFWKFERCLCSTIFFPTTKIMSLSNLFSFFRRCPRISFLVMFH